MQSVKGLLSYLVLYKTMFNCFTSFIPNFRLTYSFENQFADGTRPVHGMSYNAGVCPLTVITVAYYHRYHVFAVIIFTNSAIVINL